MSIENEVPVTEVLPPTKTNDVLLLEVVQTISKAFALNPENGWFIESFDEFFDKALDNADVLEEYDI